MNLLKKIKEAWEEAQLPGGTTGQKFKTATNKYHPHAVDKKGAAGRMEAMWFNDLWRGDTSAINPNTNKKYKKVTPEDNIALRKKMYAKYTVHSNVKHMLEDKVVFINQGEVGGCFFASILNLLQLGGKKSTVDAALKTYEKQSLAKLKREANFKNLYRKQLELYDCGYGTYYLSLKQLPQNLLSLTKSLDFQWFRYKALPGRGSRRKGTYNVKFDAKDIDGYNKNILAYLRQLLDGGYAFAAPFNGHFVAYVGYNDDGFLALGSYGEDADKAGLHEVKETILLADAINSVLYTKVSDMTMEELSEKVKIIKLGKPKKKTVRRSGRVRNKRVRKLKL